MLSPLEYVAVASHWKGRSWRIPLSSSVRRMSCPNGSANGTVAERVGQRLRGGELRGDSGQEEDRAWHSLGGARRHASEIRASPRGFRVSWALPYEAAPSANAVRVAW